LLEVNVLHTKSFAAFWLSWTFVILASYSFAQTTVSSGSIQGTIIDTSSAVVVGAEIAITNAATGRQLRLFTTASGLYNSGALIPGEYVVRVKKQGFQTSEFPVRVQVGTTSPGNLQLKPGAVKQVITVEASTLKVNTDQAVVQGVLTTTQIDQLPINGRNFLDLAQLEPGVQIQDGNSFDPTKVGLSAISFGGRFGRSTRIEVDGIDVSDEVVGTTTQDVPASAIEEFQLSQSLLDLSNELTSSGAVNAVTRSGTNVAHGEMFDFSRDSSVAAALPGPKAPFQRHQFGGNVGGPIVKDKVFFFGDGERSKQDLLAPVALPDPLAALSGSFNSPFRETEALTRMDSQPTRELHVFYHFSYSQNAAVATGFGAVSFQPFKNKNYASGHVVGADFNSGNFMHSVRFGYLNFRNDLIDAVRGSSLPLASFPVSINIGPLSTGPNFLAPQATRQTNHQGKYDGAKIVRSHILRYGLSFNHIFAGGFAKLFAITPSVFTNLGDFEEDFADNSCGAARPCFRGGRTNPLNYPVEFVLIGNGLGFLSEKPGFGFPLGGIGPDNRLGVYVGDSWKVKPNLSLAYGLRYVRDTGRTNSDLPPIEALNRALPGLGSRVRQPSTNLAPQFGIVWDPWRSGKTVLRAGAGLYYENAIWVNGLSDRSVRLPNGAFLSAPPACAGPGIATQVVFSDGSIQTPPPGTCGDAAGNALAICVAARELAAFQTFFQSVAASTGGGAPNPNFLGNLLATGGTLAGALAPQYRTPRSIQINAGVQREVRPGTIISADYLRNVSTHSLISLDANHTGDARFLSVQAARVAISATNNGFGCGTGIDAASIDCAIAAGATIVDFANSGLDSPQDLGVGACGISLGFDCAFAGLNSAAGAALFAFPIGRSVYNALQVKLTQDAKISWRPIRHINFQVSYSLSRFVNPGGRERPADSDQDQALGNFALDNRDPLRFVGPSTLDRTHQLSFGGIADLPGYFRVSFISHFYTALPATLSIPTTNFGGGEIFRTDFTGDGTVEDLVPGTLAGSFGRDIKIGDLNAVITNYNNTVAGKPTPAGQALIDAELFTNAQMLALGAVAPPVKLAPKDQVGLDALRSFDFRLSWSRKFHDPLTIEPSVAVFNLFNFANFDLPSSVLSGTLTGGPGSVNGTVYRDRVVNRVGLGTGVFALGAPRVFEFGLRLTF
jgi:hypothetical protein